MASTIEHMPSPPKTFPTQVLWTKDGGFTTYNLKTPPRRSGTSPRLSDDATEGAATMDPAQRVFRLERNLKFLKDQHEGMLRDLHVEVDTLKIKNRELQFQLIIGKSLSSTNEKLTEDKCNQADEPAIVQSPKAPQEHKATQLPEPTAVVDKQRRLSHMEGELFSLRMALEDAELRNTNLSNLVSQLKRSHLKIKSKSAAATVKQSEIVASSSPDIAPIPLSYAKKFEEYESLIGRLKRENASQKKELGHVRTCLDTYRDNVGPRENTELQRLPRIPQPPPTPPRPNQARKTSELPYIHPVSSDGLACKGTPYPSRPDQPPQPWIEGEELRRSNTSTRHHRRHRDDHAATRDSRKTKW